MVVFEAELNVLKYPVGASDGGIADVRDNVLAFLARKKEEVKVIREVSPTSVLQVSMSKHSQSSSIQARTPMCRMG